MQPRVLIDMTPGPSQLVPVATIHHRAWSCRRIVVSIEAKTQTKSDSTQRARKSDVSDVPEMQEGNPVREMATSLYVGYLHHRIVIIIKI